MAKPRKQKLKVYCTPVGFHDAYVAAPSQKAALEAWGAKTNLFAQGAAQTVTDAKLTKAPLSRPGEVIKVLRGSDAEQLAALERTVSRRKGPSPSQPTAGSLPLPQGERVKGPKPSRAKLMKAQEVLAALETRQAKALRQIDEQQRQLDRQRRELEQRQAEEIAAAEQRIEEEQERYSEAVRNWEKSG